MPIRWTTIFLDLPATGFDDAVAFWSRLTASTPSATRGPAGEFATLVPGTGDAYLRVQRVPDAGPGGVHFDLHIGPAPADSTDGATDWLDDAAAEAIALGARERSREPGLVVLDSPGGFAFCLVGWDGQDAVPAPAPVGEGGPNRLDQLALDIPPDLFDAECAFWAGLTGWELHSGSQSEFAYLDRPAGMPVRLLFHRLGQAAPGARVTGHVDVACDDRDALVAEHVAAGSRVVARFGNWVTMADPAGRSYCLTKRDPRTGMLRQPS